MNSRTKGAAGERELAAEFRYSGFDARRGQQYAGGGDSPDIVHNLPGVHVECKRGFKPDPYRAMAQAEADAPLGHTPVVCHRRDRGQWLATMRLRDWLTWCRKLLGTAPEPSAAVPIVVPFERAQVSDTLPPAFRDAERRWQREQMRKWALSHRTAMRFMRRAEATFDDEDANRATAWAAVALGAAEDFRDKSHKP